MQKIVPHIWFDKQAVEAATFYANVFPNSKIKSTTVIKDTPSGDCDIVSFEVMDYSFQAISAGPYFKLNPSISLMVNFDPSLDGEAEKKLDEVWSRLIDNGIVRMPLGEYPFSKRYGWVQDKFGVSWQLILTDASVDERPNIVPSFLFTKEMCGKTEEATNFYLSIFKESKRGTLVHYPAGMEPEKKGTVMFTDFMIAGQWFAAMDSSLKHEFSFNEAFSLMVHCDTQAEIDYFWNNLSAVPEAEQCGWCKDKYGVSWQIVPSIMEEMMTNGTPEQKNKVTQAFLKMKKFDIAVLKQAYEN